MIYVARALTITNAVGFEGEKSVYVNKAVNELRLSALYRLAAALSVLVFMEEVLKHKGIAPSL